MNCWIRSPKLQIGFSQDSTTMSEELGASGDTPNGETNEQKEPNGDTSENSPALGDESEEEKNDFQEGNVRGDDDVNEESSFGPSATDESVTEEDLPQQNVFRRTMGAAFASLRQRRDNPNRRMNSASSANSTQGPVHSCVSVNFIDPTTGATEHSPTSMTPTRKNFTLLSQLSSSEKTDASELKPALDLYEKLTAIFERDYGSTLHSIPYENVRNGVHGTIEKLKLRPVLTRSHGVTSRAGSLSSGDANVPWAGNSAAAAAPVSDPAEWHNGPYCHVYIAACESMDHYRSKVKPALQAFVSQIESAANTGSQVANTGKSGSESMSASGNYSSHYVIVYVPTGPKAQVSELTSPAAEGLMHTNRAVGAFASRLSAARRRLENPNASILTRDLGTDSIHSQATTVSGDGADTEDESFDPAAAPPPGPVIHSSKLEKELYRKFTTDFPAGQTCIMSTLVDSVDDTSLATMSPLKNQEWNTFLRMLGSAIVNGFKDRCRRYDEELRRLDAHRATSPPTSKAWKDAPRFNLSHFFLVKESLAFTYEQMQLPEDALLQYEELRAFVPEPLENDELLAEGNDNDGLIKKKKISKSKKKFEEEVDKDEAMELAIAGDSIGFRRRLRSTTDMAPLSEAVLRYLFVRETCLLFELDAPVEIIRRSYLFVEASYRVRVGRLASIQSKLSTEQLRNEHVEAEKWALNFCWDVKCACDAYFSESDMDDVLLRSAIFEGRPDEEFDDTKSTDDPAVDSGGDEGVVMVHTEKNLASMMSELLEFARVRMINLGDLELTCDNPIQSLRKYELPADMKKPWLPLELISSDKSDKMLEGDDDPAVVLIGQQRCLLDGAFDSVDSYESSYLELTEAVISFSRFAGRRRLASKLDGERAEIYIRRGNAIKAAQILLPIVDICSLDRWGRGHFWRLFRLACCQRATINVPMYLSTLTHCFGRRITPVAPQKTLELLQRDLEVVVGDSRVADFPFGIAPFLETEIGIKPTSYGITTMPLPYMRKKVVNNFCLVGETTTLELALTSHLPKAVEAQAMKLFVVAFDKYEALFHNKTTITDSDAFKILSIVAPITIQPGLNRYTFNWVPMNTGQYILSTVQIQWKLACFYYDSAAFRRPLLGINILPSEPTQTLELNPLSLIPGHVQQVRVTFNSGSDYIREGTVNLLCFEGLQIVPPGEDPGPGKWSRCCDVDLPSCPPGEKVEITTFVKTSAFSVGGVQGMQAKVATSYCHALYAELSEEEKMSTPAMKTVLEAMVSTLDRPVLTVDNVSAFTYAKNRVMISVSLHCNAPLPFLSRNGTSRFLSSMLAMV